VKCSETAANYNRLFAFLDRHGLAFNLFHQVSDSVDDTICILAGYFHFVTGPAADSQVDCIEALCKEVVDGEVSTKLDVALEVRTELPDMIDFTIHHVFRQTVFRNTVAQHAAWLWLHL